MDDELTEPEANELFEQTQHLGNMIYTLAEAELTLATADARPDSAPH